MYLCSQAECQRWAKRGKKCWKHQPTVKRKQLVCSETGCRKRATGITGLCYDHFKSTIKANTHPPKKTCDYCLEKNEGKNLFRTFFPQGELVICFKCHDSEEFNAYWLAYASKEWKQLKEKPLN